MEPKLKKISGCLPSISLLLLYLHHLGGVIKLKVMSNHSTDRADEGVTGSDDDCPAAGKKVEM